MKSQTHKMIDLAVQILLAAREEEPYIPVVPVVPETSQLKGSTLEQRMAPRTIAGYVVRYAGGGTCGSPQSGPLSYANHFSDGVVLLEAGDGIAGIGTIFPSIDAAGAAVTATVKYQKQNHLTWNEFYGHYLIDPVYA